MTHELRDHRVQHSNHALAKFRTQTFLLFSSIYLNDFPKRFTSLRNIAHAIGVLANTAC